MDDLFEPDEYGDPNRFLIPQDQRSAPDTILARLDAVLGPKVKCEPQGPYECHNWWYVPEFCIGCRGYIVDKRDDNILGLSSRGDISLSQQFTAYELGFRHDLINLTITEIHQFDDAVQFLSKRVSLWHNPREEMGPCYCPSNGDCEDWATYHARPSPKVRHWNSTEIETALQSLPFCFHSQRLHRPPFLLGADDLPFAYTLERGT